MVENTYIGIDLGTSKFCVGVMKNDLVEIIPNEQGKRLSATYVAFTQNGVIIGDEALSQLKKNPADTLYDFTSLIGAKFSDPVIQNIIKKWPFKVFENPKEQLQIEVNYQNEQKIYQPEQILVLVLQNIKQMSEKFLGKPINHAVITLPASFFISQKQIVHSAAIQSGFAEVKFIVPSTAVAFTYSLQNKSKEAKTVMVLDIGESYCNISIVNMRDRTLEVKTATSNFIKGDQDFDCRLIDYCVEDFSIKTEIDLRNQKKGMGRLKIQCEQAKKALSSASIANIEIENIYRGKDLDLKISLVLFEKISEEQCQLVRQNVEGTLKEIQMSIEQINEVILIGGNSRIPKIQRVIQDIFKGKQLCKSLHPDEAVAEGTAIYGAILGGSKAQILQNLVLKSRTTKSLGIKTIEGSIKTLIPRNSSIPIRKSQMITTSSDWNDIIVIQIVEGENPVKSDSSLVCKFVFDGIKPDIKGVPRIQVEAEIKDSEEIQIIVTNLNSNNSKTVQITSSKEYANQLENEIKQIEQERQIDLNNPDFAIEVLQEAQQNSTEAQGQYQQQNQYNFQNQ